MALSNLLQSLNLSINKPQQSKTNKTKTVYEYSLNTKPIKAKYKIEHKHISLLIATCSLTIPMSIVGCSQETKNTQNELSSISTQSQSQTVSNTP